MLSCAAHAGARAELLTHSSPILGSYNSIRPRASSRDPRALSLSLRSAPMQWALLARIEAPPVPPCRPPQSPMLSRPFSSSRNRIAMFMPPTSWAEGGVLRAGYACASCVRLVSRT